MDVVSLRSTRHKALLILLVALWVGSVTGVAQATATGSPEAAGLYQSGSIAFRWSDWDTTCSPEGRLSGWRWSYDPAEATDVVQISVDESSLTGTLPSSSGRTGNLCGSVTHPGVASYYPAQAVLRGILPYGDAADGRYLRFEELHMTLTSGTVHPHWLDTVISFVGEYEVVRQTGSGWSSSGERGTFAAEILGSQALSENSRHDYHFMLYGHGAGTTKFVSHGAYGTLPGVSADT